VQVSAALRVFPNAVEQCIKRALGLVMSFDTSTLYLSATLVAGMVGAMLLFFGRQEKIAALNW